MARRTLAGMAALVAASAVMTPTVAEASPPGSKDVTAVLFEWNFASVARECTTTLGPAGYGYVQVSRPPSTYRARSGGPRTSPSVTRSPDGSATAPPSRTWWTRVTRPA